MTHSTRLLLAASIGLALAGGTALAQPMAGASGPMGAASMPHDCKPMHASGADKSMPMMKNCQMGAAGAASAPASRPKGKPSHDHSKVHKNQG